MRTIVLIATLVCAAAMLAAPAPAATQRTSCSDVAWLTATIKALKKGTAALKLAQQNRYSAALVPARQSLAIAKRAPQPCDSNYRLQRIYEIHYGVAAQRWLEEMRDGDTDSADVYWTSLKFWSTQIRDLNLEK